MIFQILRTVLVGAAIYFFSKVIRGAIDKKLDPPNVEDQDNAQRPPKVDMPEKLVPCPNCNIYYNPNHPPECGDQNCPLKSGE